MLLGCIADDFTGASDLANTLRKEGMTVTQFVGIPETAADPGCEAGVVALKIRSVPVEEACAAALRALDWLQKQGCRQILFKYCSTFDSTREGNIGPVAETLRKALGAAGALVCPAFPGTGRTIYQGYLFVKDRLLSESGMEHHPLNPMTDPDLRRWLSYQTGNASGLIPLDVVRSGPEAIAAGFVAEVEAGRALVVCDAISDADLREIGQALDGHPLVTGGSGIALGLPANFRRAGLAGQSAPRPFAPASGPGVALSGSCSPASRHQLDLYLQDHPGIRVDPEALMQGAISAESVLKEVMAQIDQMPMVYSTADPAAVAAAQARFGTEAVAGRIEAFFSTLAAGLTEQGVTRIAVGGGETSGAVVQGIGAKSLAIGPEVDPGVPALEVEGTAVRLALKSGNFGAPDFYAKALNMLGKA